MEDMDKNITKGIEQKEGIEQVPVVDIVRHGKTKYKELTGELKMGKEGGEDRVGNWLNSFKKEGGDWDEEKLNEKHLDITDEGVEDLKGTANQLDEIIDRENEAVVLVSSPRARALSSMMVVGNELEKKGIEVIYHTPKIDYDKSHIAGSLNQRSLEDESKYQKALEVYIQYLAEKKGDDSKPLGQKEIHSIMAERLGEDEATLFTENHKEIDVRFRRFLRHAINLHKVIKDESVLSKKPRIIAFTHEEVPIEFIEEVFGRKESLEKGQIMEINPDEFIDETYKLKGEAIIYPKQDDEEIISSLDNVTL